MKPLDRVLRVTSVVFGLAAFALGVVSDQSVEVAISVAALAVGLPISRFVPRLETCEEASKAYATPATGG